MSITFAVFGKKGARLESEIYNFTPKFQNATKNNILSGITFFAWISILWRRLYDIDFTTYWRRIVFITFMSILNSMIGCLEHFWYGSAIQRQSIHEEPVFILGHPELEQLTCLTYYLLTENLHTQIHFKLDSRLDFCCWNVTNPI